MDEEDKVDKVGVVDVANAHRLQTTCKTKRRVAVDVATLVLSLLRQEGWESLANQQRNQQHTQTLQKCSQIGMYATRAGSILKTDIRRSHAHMGGTNQPPRGV